MVRYLAVLAGFTLGNSSDAFLLLRAQEAACPCPSRPVGPSTIWSSRGRHARRRPLGRWARGRVDRVRLGGYAAAYAGFAVAAAAWQIWALFEVYVCSML